MVRNGGLYPEYCDWKPCRPNARGQPGPLPVYLHFVHWAHCRPDRSTKRLASRPELAVVLRGSSDLSP